MVYGFHLPLLVTYFLNANGVVILPLNSSRTIPLYQYLVSAISLFILTLNQVLYSHRKAIKKTRGEQ